MKKKIFYTIVFTVITIITSVGKVFAEAGPCDNLPLGPDDPGCNVAAPLDTYVYILAIIAIIYTFYHLQKQKKSLAVK